MINEVVLQPARCLSMNVQVYQPSTLKKKKINKIWGVEQMLFLL